MLVNISLLGNAAWTPDFLAVGVGVLVHPPAADQLGIGVAFFFGLASDVHQATLMGQHALTYTGLGFLATHDAPSVAVVYGAFTSHAGVAFVFGGSLHWT
jgi:rod shape-determining protein MreD